MGFWGDYFSGKFTQWLEGKAKENPLYQKLTNQIPIVSSQNSELNQLLEESFKIAKTNSIIGILPDDEIVKSIDLNIDTIFEYITLSNEDLPLSKFLFRIKYVNDNEEHCKNIETFYKSLYQQLHDRRQNYPTLQNLKIQKKLENMEEGMQAGFSNINEMLMEIKTHIGYESLSYHDELNGIEEKLKNRNFFMVREMALNLEDKIVKSGKPDEIEKLYALIINSYLFEGGNQEESLDYFDKLIFHTTDTPKKKSRNILRLIIKRDFQNAQAELNNVFSTGDPKEIDAAFYEHQINLYYMSGNFDAANSFIKDKQAHIKKYQYFLALALIQQRKFEEANSLLEANGEFFNDDDFDIQETRTEIRCHYLLKKFRNTTTIDIINQLKELSLEIKSLIAHAGDSSIKKSYLHSMSAIILAATFEREKAKSEYEKSLELDPNNYNALKNYPYLLLDNTDNMEKGLVLIQKYLEKYPDSLEDKMLYFLILTNINPEKVIKEFSEQKPNEIDLRVYLVYALDKTNQCTKAEANLKELIEEYGNEFSVHFCAGWHYFDLNDYTSAMESFLTAYSLCKDENDYDSVFYYLLRIICTHYCFGKISIVKNFLETKYGRDIILLKFPRYYIHILLLQNDYAACIECCDRLRKNGINADYIAEAEFTCYYNTQNFQNVKQVLAENRIKYPDEILVRMAHACAGIGEYKLVKDLIKKTKKPRSKEDYIILARLLFSIKEYQDTLSTIHSAYLTFPKDRSIQEFFIVLVFGHHIQPQSDDIANSFRDCLQSYRAAKYDNKLIQEFTLPEGADGEEILRILEKQFPNNHDFDKRIELIREKRLPISFYTSIFRESIFSIHDMVARSANDKIWCTEQFGKDCNNIGMSPLYIDLSSLITLELLSLLDAAGRLFPQIYFTQSVIDAILIFDNKLSEPFCDHVVISYGNYNDFFGKKSNEEIIAEMKNRMQRLKSFVFSGGNIHVVGTVLQPKRMAPEYISDFLLNYQNVDISEGDTMCFAYLADCQVMIESVALRAAFNHFENSPFGFGIDSLLKYLLEKSFISRNKYYLSLTLLIENNYARIPVSAEHLIFIIKYEGYTILQKHNKLFDCFCSHEFDFFGIITILTYVLAYIWNDIVPSERKKMEWSDYLFGKIALNLSMNDNWEYKIMYYIGAHIVTKQNIAGFIEYTQRRMFSHGRK